MRLPTIWGRDKDEPFASLQREVEKVFDDFTRNWPSVGAFTGRAMMPTIDVHETDKGLEVTAELPGVDEKDVEVTLVDNLLTIKGEKKYEHKEGGEGRMVSERSYGAFQRSFTLPYEVDANKIDAKVEKGVLKLTLPKSPDLKKKTKKITIKGAK